jgi:hypothetical protein
MEAASCFMWSKSPGLADVTTEQNCRRKNSDLWVSCKTLVSSWDRDDAMQLPYEQRTANKFSGLGVFLHCFDRGNVRLSETFHILAVYPDLL